MGERVAIGEGRERTDRAPIEAAVAALPDHTTVITGGCSGPDQWTEAAARARGLPVEVYRPDLGAVTARYMATIAYYKCNGRIVERCDRLIAFPVAPHGGTWFTIKAAVVAGKHVTIVPCPTATSGQEP